MGKMKGLLTSIMICTLLMGSLGLALLNTNSNSADTTIGMFSPLEDTDPWRH